jgi:ubiquinone/menaquinone biosynthesis C-methylase UbiE
VQPITDTKTEKVADIISRLYPDKIERLLVVGCGDGTEAAVLAAKLHSKVIGIDVVDGFDRVARVTADLRVGDAMHLDFPDESFDFVFSYHALEHITDPNLALREMNRVLRPGGGFWIGTPNRARIVGYIGAKNATLVEKLTWNASDYRARMAGRFRNELGAHAGFTNSELHDMLKSVFSEVEDVTGLYFRTVYAHKKMAAPIIAAAEVAHFLYPSVYFHGTK